MSERVRIRKVGTRDGRPTNLDDGHVVEGDELAEPTPGTALCHPEFGDRHPDAPEVFATSRSER